MVNLDTRAALRQAQEFGHYFGLLALNVEPAPADAPATPHWRAWIDAGAPPCGNLASLTLNGKTFLPDRTNAESAWGCALGRSQGALTPMQLARASWTLRYQLNRLPLTACGPAAPYNADVVNCEDFESLALCKETSAYLQRTTGAETLACRGGGAIQRAISGALKWVGVDFLFKSTPQGQALVNALAGRGGAANPAPEAIYDEIVKAFEAGKNRRSRARSSTGFPSFAKPRPATTTRSSISPSPPSPRSPWRPPISSCSGATPPPLSPRASSPMCRRF